MQILGFSQADKTIYNTITPNDRFVLNLEGNMQFKERTRLYLDLEKSLGGDIFTNFQVNLGARYSFGEKQTLKIQKG